MPTGYTADVATGKITEFEDYAMGCARAFGALISMRDESGEAEIPDKFEPSEYNKNQLEKSRKELNELESLTIEQLDAKAKGEFEAAMKRNNESLVQIKEQQSRYEAMLEQANAYEPPTSDHIAFGEFIVDQLVKSIDFDCRTKYYEENKPVLLSGIEFKSKRKTELQRSIEYHTEEMQKEIERTERKNQWLADLRESIRSVTK